MAQVICNYFSNALKRNAKVVILLPSVSPDDFLDDVKVSYFDEGSRFQTLYLLHGSYGSATDWSLNANAERYAQENCLALVMPEVENSCYLDLEYGEAYQTFCGKELPEFLSTLFPLAKKRENRFVAGLSMGGFGALSLSLAYPEAFSKVVALSAVADMKEVFAHPLSAHGRKMPSAYKKLLSDGNEEKMDLYARLAERTAQKAALPSYCFLHGDKDPFLSGTMAFADKMKASGFEVDKLTAPGKHDWIFWDTYIQEAIRWLKPAKSTVIE